jgi:hypothetical protein
MPNALSDVQNTFTTLDAQYNMLRAACTTDADRNALAGKYATAQKNYQTCIGQMLSDDDAQVAALSAQLKAANTEVAKAVTEMGNMSKVLDNITQAITLGAQLITKAGL